MAIKDKKYYDFLDEAVKRNSNGESWAEICKDYVQIFGEYISRSAMRHRAQDYSRSKSKMGNKFSKSTTFTTTLGCGFG